MYYEEKKAMKKKSTLSNLAKTVDLIGTVFAQIEHHSWLECQEKLFGRTEVIFKKTRNLIYQQQIGFNIKWTQEYTYLVRKIGAYPDYQLWNAQGFLHSQQIEGALLTGNRIRKL